MSFDGRILLVDHKPFSTLQNNVTLYSAVLLGNDYFDFYYCVRGDYFIPKISASVVIFSSFVIQQLLRI